MSVIVKNMEMPKNCAECRLWDTCEYMNEFDDWASILDAVEDGNLVRDKNCPLIEVPPHGDLIDKDWLIQELASYHVGGLKAIQRYTGADTWESGLHTAWRAIDDADTIIEAEGEK